MADEQKRKGANPSRSRKNVLGRGLSALMSASAVEVEPSREPVDRLRNFREVPKSNGTAESTSALEKSEAVPAQEEVAPEGGLVYLSIERIRRNTDQPRQHFAQEDIDSLAESIKESGLLQPIIVRRRAGEVGPLASYEIVAGERRWRAAKSAGLNRIPALVRQLSDKETLELGIIENVQRADLNPLEEAHAYQRLIKEFGATQEEVAQSVSKDRTSIANALRLLKLAAPVQKMLLERGLSAGHARALLMCSSETEQVSLAERVLSEGLSVRQTERLAKGEELLQSPAEGPVKKPLPRPVVEKVQSPSVRALEERFRRALGTKVSLRVEESGAGELRISFFSQDELDNVIEKLGA